MLATDPLQPFADSPLEYLKIKKILVIFGVLFLSYAGFVVAWSVSDDESRKAVQILGGCESKDPLARGIWSFADRAVPPSVRCVVRAFKKDQILAAKFRFARVGTAERPIAPDELGGLTMTPVQFYVYEGARWSLEFTSSNPKINIAMQRTMLGSLDWLLENGADPNECNVDGLVPLHIAAKLNRDDLYAKWVAQGANPDIECPGNKYSEMGITPREWSDRP